jgi:hypothetical protein
MKRAFTIVELLVAMGLLAAMIAGSGLIFRTAVKAQRTASATSEISRKLAAIRSQLNADFQGLRKDGEIFVVWIPGVDITGDDVVDEYERLDRILFFTDGDFQTYRQQPTLDPLNPAKLVHGNVARICYALANFPDGRKASDMRGLDTLKERQQLRRQRILSRTQHIITADADLADLPVVYPVPPAVFDEAGFRAHNFAYEFDKSYMTLQGWKDIADADKDKILTIATGIIVDRSGDPSALPPDQHGATIDPADPDTIHMLFCQGVGEFSVQGWSDVLQRWVPEVDPDGDGVYSDSDFPAVGAGVSAGNFFPGIIYPGKLHDLGGNPFSDPELQYDTAMVTEANFNNIPGLGRALKFTFKLYDSRGIFKDGKTFTHIVYLGG